MWHNQKLIRGKEEKKNILPIDEKNSKRNEIRIPGKLLLIACANGNIINSIKRRKTRNKLRQILADYNYKIQK